MNIEQLAILANGIIAVAELIDESYGVAGLHLNGDVATWEELRTGGTFEAWLMDFDSALKEAKRLAGGEK